ncbi:hypothetical protein L1887_44944 [Cichorium endivia]|nr:hypothetical protein L1887_44944 [Cichorium endivia]
MVFCRWLRGAWGINEKNDPHKQNNQRTDDRDGETAEVKAIDFTKTEQRTDPAADYRADNTQYYGDDKPTTIFARHDPLRQNTRNKPKDNPG